MLKTNTLHIKGKHEAYHAILHGLKELYEVV
jgi:hypothetical protein